MPTRSGPPTVSGRWSLLPEPEADLTRRLHAVAQTMLDRHGILTRGAVAAERLPGGFGALYPVLRAMEEAGQCRRGYFVEGLGAAQFALPGAVDRMRALAAEMTGPAGEIPGPAGQPPVSSSPSPHPQAAPGATPWQPGAAPGSAARQPEAAPGSAPRQPEAAPGPGSHTPAPPYAGPPVPDTPAVFAGPAAAPKRPGHGVDALVLAAADPASPFGSALPWPDRPGEVPGAHRPGRKAGALVVLCRGELVLYVERGGKTLLSWTSDPAMLAPAAAALAAAVRAGALGRLTVERADGSAVYDTPLAQALADAGFRPTPRGLRLRA